MRYRLAIFDLDGTLVDSFAWFLTHFNDVADRYGFRRIVEVLPKAGDENVLPKAGDEVLPKAGDEVLPKAGDKSLLPKAGNESPLPQTGDAQLVLSEMGQELRHAGSREILTRLDVPKWKVPMIARHVRRLKTAHVGDVTLFPGASHMLRALKDAGVTLALVSSDNEANVRSQLGCANAALFSDFACGASLFGKARKFRRVLRRAGVAPSHAIAIGDEVRDIEAARTVGIPCAAVAWGYAAPEKLRSLQPDLMFERIDEIAERLAPRSCLSS